MTKQCTKCNEVKELGLFSDRKSAKSGKQDWCKNCVKIAVKTWETNNPTKLRLTKNTWAKANPDKIKDKKLRQRYGITLIQYNQMLSDQNGKCAICKRAQEGKALYVDHNHKTKVVRQLLCHSCNSAIGYIKEDISVLKSIEEYLVKHYGNAN